MSELSDLEITRKCAEAMGLETSEWSFSTPSVSPTCIAVKAGVDDGYKEYDPLTDDAQCFALLKRFKLHSYTVTGMSDHWVVHQASGTHTGAQSTDLNRAICLCVARMKGATEKGAEG